MASVTHARKPVSPPKTRGRPGTRVTKAYLTTTLAFDPGKHTGYALLAHPSRPQQGAPRLHAAGTVLLKGDYQQLALALDALLDEKKPDRVVVEGWENQGVRTNIHSSTPNVLIGM